MKIGHIVAAPGMLTTSPGSSIFAIVCCDPHTGQTYYEYNVYIREYFRIHNVINVRLNNDERVIIE